LLGARVCVTDPFAAAADPAAADPAATSAVAGEYVAAYVCDDEYVAAYICEYVISSEGAAATGAAAGGAVGAAGAAGATGASIGATGASTTLDVCVATCIAASLRAAAIVCVSRFGRPPLCLMRTATTTAISRKPRSGIPTAANNSPASMDESLGASDSGSVGGGFRGVGDIGVGGGGDDDGGDGGADGA